MDYTLTGSQFMLLHPRLNIQMGNASTVASDQNLCLQMEQRFVIQ